VSILALLPYILRLSGKLTMLNRKNKNFSKGILIPNVRTDYFFVVYLLLPAMDG